MKVPGAVSKQELGDQEDFDPRRFGAVAGRINDLAADRLDIHFAAQRALSADVKAMCS